LAFLALHSTHRYYKCWMRETLRSLRSVNSNCGSSCYHCCSSSQRHWYKPLPLQPTTLGVIASHHCRCDQPEAHSMPYTFWCPLSYLRWQPDAVAPPKNYGAVVPTFISHIDAHRDVYAAAACRVATSRWENQSIINLGNRPRPRTLFQKLRAKG